MATQVLTYPDRENLESVSGCPGACGCARSISDIHVHNTVLIIEA